MTIDSFLERYLRKIDEYRPSFNYEIVEIWIIAGVIRARTVPGTLGLRRCRLWLKALHRGPFGIGLEPMAPQCLT